MAVSDRRTSRIGRRAAAEAGPQPRVGQHQIAVIAAALDFYSKGGGVADSQVDREANLLEQCGGNFGYFFRGAPPRPTAGVSR